MSTTTAPAAVARRGRTPFWEAVGIIAQREILTKVRSKAFLISTGIFLLLIAAMTAFSAIGPQLFDDETHVGATAETAAELSGVEGTTVETFESADAVRDAVAAGTVDAGVVSGQGPLGLTVIGDREVPSDVVQLLSAQPAVELLDPNAPNPALTYLIAFGFGIIFFTSALTFGQTIAQSVVEEKQSRIVELMLATVPARAILAGKVIGNSLLAFGQIALIAAIVLIVGALTNSPVLLDGLGMPIVWFVLLFTVGFVMLATLYAAAAALVSRVEDLGSATSPIMMLIMLPYFAVIMFNNNPTALQIMSYVPFSAPVAVPMRVYLGTAAWWEPVLSLVILIATTVAAIAFASRVYENSLLKTGAAVKWKDALKA